MKGVDRSMNQNDFSGLERKMKELIWSEVYHDTIRGSKWLSQDLAFSPGRGAIGYQLMYVLYRVLNEVNPTSVLELGMGQSTKLIGSYVASANGECKHYVVEHDENWIEFFSNHYPLPNTTEVVRCAIEDTPVIVEEENRFTNVTKYVGFEEQLKDKKFDLIMIDGPYGYRSPDFSRVDILSILPQCLKEEFVILMDDCDRKGEQQTCQMIGFMLQEAGIPFYSGTYSGEKDVTIIVSQNLKFLCLM